MVVGAFEGARFTKRLPAIGAPSSPVYGGGVSEADGGGFFAASPPSALRATSPVNGERETRCAFLKPLIPAKAGIHDASEVLCFWIPAFAGMSGERSGVYVSAPRMFPASE